MRDLITCKWQIFLSFVLINLQLKLFFAYAGKTFSFLKNLWNYIFFLSLEKFRISVIVFAITAFNTEMNVLKLLANFEDLSHSKFANKFKILFLLIAGTAIKS